MKADKKLRNLTSRSIIPAEYYDMFAMRVKGADYQQIAQATGYSYGHVRTLFSRSGKLYQFYRDYVEEHKAEAIEQATDIMFEHLPETVKANIAHGLMPTEGAVMSRKLTFEYTLGSPEQKIKLDARVGVFTMADFIKAKTLEAEEEAKQNEPIQPTGLSEESN